MQTQTYGREVGQSTYEQKNTQEGEHEVSIL